MKQGRMFLALALGALVAASAALPARVDAAAKKAPAAASAAAKKKSYAFRQFTGTVTALDKATLTVEKTGKLAKTLVFTRHAEMKTTGDLRKDARVTVYYRDEDGHPVAHKVVVKDAVRSASR